MKKSQIQAGTIWPFASSTSCFLGLVSHAACFFPPERGIERPGLRENLILSRMWEGGRNVKDDCNWLPGLGTGLKIDCIVPGKSDGLGYDSEDPEKFVDAIRHTHVCLSVCGKDFPVA